MTFLDGEKISEVLEDKNYLNISEEIGKRVKELHLMDIIHGDLTTSNMILADDKIHLIDFGLSFFSKKIEDKAVDIHLLKSALESKHHRIYDKCFKRIIKVYLEDNPSGKEIIAKIKTVESRGRNKSK
jgi:Kae1-associated kinase Bud32